MVLASESRGDTTGSPRLARFAGAPSTTPDGALKVSQWDGVITVLTVDGELRYRGRPIPPPPFTDPIEAMGSIDLKAVLMGDGRIGIFGSAAESIEPLQGVFASDQIVDLRLYDTKLGVLTSDGEIHGIGDSFGTPFNHVIGVGGVVDFDLYNNSIAWVKADGSVVNSGGIAQPTPVLDDAISVRIAENGAMAVVVRANGGAIAWGPVGFVNPIPSGSTDIFKADVVRDQFLSTTDVSILRSDSTFTTYGASAGKVFDGFGIVDFDLGRNPGQLSVIEQQSAAPCARLLPASSTKVAGRPHLMKLHNYAPVASYQWKLDGVPIAGATKPHLYIAAIDKDDAGSYTVELTNQYGTFETAPSILALDLPSQTLDFPPVADRTFGDPDFDVMATASSGLPVSFSIASGPATVSGSTISITGAGTVVVRADQDGAGDFDPISVERSFEVAKLAASVSLSGLGATYDGTPKMATASTNPPGLNVSFTYAGSATPPTAAGSYAVQAQIDEANYSGIAAGTLVIAKSSQVITFPPLADRVFGDGPAVLGASTSSGLAVEYQLVDGPATLAGGQLTITGAGLITARATQPGNMNFEPATPVERSFVVAKAAQAIEFPPIAPRRFDQGAFAPEATSSSGLPVGLAVISGPATASGGSVTPTGVGLIVLRATQGGDGNWEPAIPVEVTVSVAKGEQSIDFQPLPDRVFDSGAFAIAATADSGLAVTFEIVSGPATLAGGSLEMTGAGQITIRASQPGDDRYLEASPVERTFLAGFSLEIAASTGGTVSASPDLNVYPPGDQVALQPSEAAGFRFKGWEGGASGADSPLLVTMDQNRSISAVFAEIVNLDVSAGAGGSVMITPEKDEYVAGDVVTLTPVPEPGYALTEWGGAASGAEDPLVLTLEADTTVTADFEDVAAPAVTLFSPHRA